MAQEKGATAILTMGRESVWGTAATGNFLQLPIISVEGGLTQGLSQSQALQGSRNQPQPFLDEKQVRLTLTLQPDVRSIGYVFAEIFGLPTTTGAGPTYTHVFKIGNSLPIGATLEKFFGINSLPFQYLGCKFGGFSLELSSGRVLTMRCDVMGMDRTNTARIDAAPYKYPLAPFRMGKSELYEDGVQLVRKATRFSMDFSNEIEEIRTVASGATVGNLLEGVTAVRGQLATLFEGMTRIDKGTNETETGLKVKFPSPTNVAHHLTLESPEALLSVTDPGIPGPGGTVVEQDYIAYLDNDAGASALIATLVNDVASYATIPA